MQIDSHSSTSLSVLIVEDNPADADLITDYLEEAFGKGQMTTHCTRLRDAVAHKQESPVDVLLLDLHLPDADGIEAITQARQTFTDIPIIVLTGEEAQGMSVKSVEAGVQDYLPKHGITAGLLKRSIEYARTRQKMLLEQHEKEQDLARSQAQLSTVLQNISDGVLVVDPAGSILFANPQAQIMLAPEYTIDTGVILDHTLLPAEETEVAMHQTSSPRVFNIRSSDALWEGVPARFLTIRDVTAQKDAETALMRKERLAAVGLLASGIAHHFNNIHGGCVGFLDLALMDNNLSEQTRKRLEKAQLSLQSAVELTHNLLDTAYAGKRKLELLSLDLVVRSILDLVRDNLEALEITLHSELRQIPPFLLDRAEMSQVILNLISNARDAVHQRPAPTIHISTNVEKGCAVVVVQDNGCGIADHEKETIFSPFYTKKGAFSATKTSDTALNGTGLGLAINTRIMTQYHGKIEVESQEGHGALFKLIFPLDKQATALPEAECSE